MLFQARSSIAVAALVGCVIADTQPLVYKPMLGRMSTNNVLGRRQEDGNAMCIEDYGPTAQQCASTDGKVHCYLPAAQESCCPYGAGQYCEQGFYCAEDPGGETVCCSNTLSLADCATDNEVSGSLTSKTAQATSTYPVPEPATSTIVSLSITSNSSTAAASTVVNTPSAAETQDCTTYTTQIIQTIVPIPSTDSESSTSGTASTGPVSTTRATTTVRSTATVSTSRASVVTSTSATATSPVQARGCHSFRWSWELVTALVAVAGLASLL